MLITSKKSHTVWLSMAFALLVVGCSEDDKQNPLSSVRNVDPSSPDEVSRVLFIPDSRREEGSPPTESVSAARPQLTNSRGGNEEASRSNLPAISGGSPLLTLELDSQAGYQQCYVQVVGASDYLVIDTPQGEGTQSGALQIPIEFDQNANFLSNEPFCVYTCVRDQNGLVSNPVEQCFDAIPASTERSRTFCVDDYPEDACQLLLGDEDTINQFASESEFDPSVFQNLEITGTFIPNQMCDVVAPQVEETEFEFSESRCNGTIGVCGACVTTHSF